MTSQTGYTKHLLKKIDTVVFLTAIWATKGRSFEDRVSILRRLEFTDNQISLITGKTLADVKEVIL